MRDKKGACSVQLAGRVAFVAICDEDFAPAGAIISMRRPLHPSGPACFASVKARPEIFTRKKHAPKSLPQSTPSTLKDNGLLPASLSTWVICG